VRGPAQRSGHGSSTGGRGERSEHTERISALEEIRVPIREPPGAPILSESVPDRGARYPDLRFLVEYDAMSDAAARTKGGLFTGLKDIVREIWENLPVWFILIEGCALLNTTLSNIPDAAFLAVGIPRGRFALLQLPSSLLFYLYYRRRRPRLAVIAAFIIPVLIALVPLSFPGARVILPPATLRLLYEISAFLWTVLLGSFALLREKKGVFAAFFGVALVYGFILENAGIILGFFEEKGFHVYLGPLPAPFATTVGWCFILFCCVWTANRLTGAGTAEGTKPSAVRMALLTTAIAVSLDLQIDALASLPDVFWKWNELLPPFWFGVPFCNYAAWFGAIFIFVHLFSVLSARPGLTEGRRNFKLLIQVPAMAVLAALIWILLMLPYEFIHRAGGVSFPTLRILGRFFRGS
jgi:uncharacterized membrane protein